MDVKCPYCGCCYEIDAGILNKPIGDERLGYGWWLRCYRCKRKWWLKNTAVELATNMPIKVDKSAKIQKISDLTKKKSERSEIRKVAYAKYIFILILIGLGALCYQYRAVFYDYLYKKAKQLSENVSGKVTMTDVKYDISIGNLLTVSGNVFNYDERTIAKVNGVKISIFDDKSLVFSWDEKFEELRILPQQNVPFSTSKQLPGDIKGMRVEVSIF